MKSGVCLLPNNEDCELGTYPLIGVCTEIADNLCSYYDPITKVCVGCVNEFRLDYEDPDVPSCIEGHL